MTYENNQTTADEAPKEIRSDIENTRDEMSRTLEAIADKVDPQKVKARAQEAVIGRAQGLAEQAKEKIAPVVGIAQDLMHSAEAKVQQITDKGTVPEGDGTLAEGAARPVTSKELKPIDQQVVVVFGASSGIGRETALEFARQGAKVVAAARSESALDSLQEDFGHLKADTIVCVADAADFAQVKSVAERAVEKFGRIDTWVHCAGISLYATFENTTPEEFKQVIEVNLMGAVHGAQAALPHLRRERRGALIVISSVEGKVALPFQSAYSSSKHAIIGFLDALRLELQDEGVPIAVTNVMPAGINTPFFNKAKTKLGVKPQPMAPIYQPSVVAETILYAAQHPTRDIVAGGAGKMLNLVQKLSPALLDKMLLKSAFEGQKSDQEKGVDAPDNLYKTLDGPAHIGGDFSNSAKSKSWGTWLETHPQAQNALKAAAFVGAVVLLTRRR